MLAKAFRRAAVGRCAQRLCQEAAGPVHRAAGNRVWAAPRYGQARSMGLYEEMLAMAGRAEAAQSSRRPLPDHIVRPDYALTGTPSAKLPRAQWMIEQHSDEDIELARTAGRISREVLDEVGKAVAVGVTTDELDRICHEAAIARGAYPSPLNYHGFPRSVCTSLNEVVCHGIPENRVLKEGDILNIDVSCYVGGFHGDNSEMFCVGEVDDAAKHLIQVSDLDWQRWRPMSRRRHPPSLCWQAVVPICTHHLHLASRLLPHCLQVTCFISVSISRSP
jgi:hypothetical protein